MRSVRVLPRSCAAWSFGLLLFLVMFSQSASGDVTGPLPRVPVCGDQDGSELPFVLGCADYVRSVDVQTFQVPGTGPVDVRFDFIFREAAFNNELVVFRVDDPSGAIDDVMPGDAGYMDLVLARSTTIFASGSDAFSEDVTLRFNGGEILAFFIVMNSSLDALRTTNPGTQLELSPIAVFSLDRLNPDAVDHFVGFNNTVTSITQFAFEDILGGGDLDYDDVVFTVTPALGPLTGKIVLSPQFASLQLGQSHQLTALVRDEQGNPVSDVLVGFVVTGANSTSGSATTDDLGMATFSYIGINDGGDSIVASTTLLGDEVASNTSRATWLTDLPPSEVELNIVLPSGGVSQKKQSVHKGQLWLTFLDIASDEQLDFGSRFPNDACYFGAVDASTQLGKKKYTSLTLNELASGIAQAPLGIITTGTGLGDALLKVGSFLLSVAFSESLDRATLEFITEQAVGFVLGHASTDFIAGLAGDPVSEKVMKELLREDGVLFDQGSATNELSPFRSAGAPLTQVVVDLVYNPYTHFVVAVIGADCQAATGQVRRQYIFRFEVDKNGLKLGGATILAVPRN